MAMDNYKDVRKMLAPRRDIKASAEFRHKIEKSIHSSRRKPFDNRWLLAGLGLGAIASILLFLMIPNGVSAKETLRAALSALRKSEAIDMIVEIRTDIRETFEYIFPKEGFIKHEIKLIRSDSTTYWYINKGFRGAEKNPEGTYVWIEPLEIGWLYRENHNVLGYLEVLTKPEKILESELRLALSSSSSDYKIEKKGGLIYLTVHSMPTGDFSNPYVLNTSIPESENIRTYIIDASDYRLKSISVNVLMNSEPVEVLRLTDINYDPADKKLPSIPKDVKFIEVGGESITSGIPGLSEVEAATVVLNALNNWDRDILDRFIHPIEAEKLYRDYYEGARLLEIGVPFKSGKNKDLTFVPYTLRLRDGDVRKGNLALLRSPSGLWLFDGGL